LTINQTDVWRKAAIDDRFCVVCFALADSRTRQFPTLLRAVFRLPAFRTKTRRMGKVLRVTRTAISYYTDRDRQLRELSR
jgi:hypothetical protein